MRDSDIQNAINSWHAQPAIHGLHSAPVHRYVQLPRRDRDTPQGVVKRMGPLNLENKLLQFPVLRSHDRKCQLVQL